MENNEINIEKLDEVISDGLDNLDINDEKYCDKAKVVGELYRLRLDEIKAQNDYAIRSDEVANKTSEIDNEKSKEEEESHWWKKINPNTVITTVAMGIGTLITLKYEKDGYLFKPGDFMRGLINRNK